MKLSELFHAGKCPLALEVFPPKRHSKVESIYQMLGSLVELPVDYISVTYSAGGNGAREYTAQIAGYLKAELGAEALAHLTCLYANEAEIGAELAQLRKAGVENILALRGDAMPEKPAAGSFTYASDLMRAIVRRGDFYLVGACYPEGHPESPSPGEDIDNLRRKQASGAGHFVSQLFFDNSKFFRFLELARAAGVHCPIEAGVMPIVRAEQINRTVALSSASLPSAFTRLVSRWGASPDDFQKAGLEYAVLQIRQLIEGGADGIHLYIMNKPEVARGIYAGIADFLH